jgi:hypothetical protein
MSMAGKARRPAGRGDRAPDRVAHVQQGEATELAARVRYADEQTEQVQRRIARAVRLVPTKPFTIDVSGRLEAAIITMPYGRDVACFDRDGRCFGFIAQPERMTIELVLVHPDPEYALKAVRAGQIPEAADLAAALAGLPPVLRDWLVQNTPSKPKRGRGRPTGSGRHLLDFTHDVWRAEALFALETGSCRTVDEAIEAVAGRHRVAVGTVRNNLGALTNK